MRKTIILRVALALALVGGSGLAAPAGASTAANADETVDVVGYP